MFSEVGSALTSNGREVVVVSGRLGRKMN